MTDEEFLIIEPTICKSVSGGEDENGNYVFEVEASNENLDLQNQITLQSALKKSQEYFITNGVISDDHQHKTRLPDGSVETHKEKIIGEPISVRFDPSTKQTFVKGLLYKGIAAAKPYIDLLKNKSRLVKASIGGIMPKIKQNSDGTETVTSFMWNDLALTCSPVNWTVGSAKFAKSISMVDFCKSLEAGYGTDAATMTDGRSLQSEDMEKETEKIMDITDGNITGDDKSDDLEKSNDDKSIIRAAVKAIDSGDLKTRADIEKFFIERGFNRDKASETTLEIIKQGGTKMQKSHFSSTINDLLKSFEGDEDIEKSQKDSKKEEAKDTLFDDEDKEPEDDSDSEEEVEKCAVKKSMDEDGDYLDATELMKSMGETIDSQKEEIESLKKSLAEVQENMIEVTKSFGDFIKTPEARKSVITKSVDGTAAVSNGPAKRPSNADFDILKSCLVKAVQNKEIGLEAVQFYNSEFQKSMKGIKVSPKVWNEICTIVQKNR